MSGESDRSENFLARNAWVPLFLFSIIMLIIGIGGMVGPVIKGSVLVAFGTIVPDGLFVLISAASLILAYPRTSREVSHSVEGVAAWV